MSNDDPIAPSCRVCGCSDYDPCHTPDGPCYWAAPDLCSACAPDAAAVPLVLPATMADLNAMLREGGPRQ